MVHNLTPVKRRETHADLEHVNDGDVFAPGLVALQLDVDHAGSSVVDFHLELYQELSFKGA